MPRRILRPVLCLSCIYAFAALPAMSQGFWELQRPVPTNNTLFAIDALDGNRVVACGSLGQIVRTGDGGATWKEAMSGTTLRLFGLASAAGNPHALFAVGDSGTLIASTDGGLTWKPQASGTKATLHAVSAVDAKTAFAGGAQGTLLKTEDAGDTWIRLESGTSLTFRAISAADAQVVYAVSTRDSLFKSSDGGDTWKSHFIAPIQGMDGNGAGLQGVSAVSRDTVFATALDVQNSFARRWVYRTTDGGANWSRVDSTGGSASYAISAVSGRTAFVAGLSQLHSTQDAGATWITMNMPWVDAGRVQYNHAITAVDADTAFATGSFGMIMATTDGGRTWNQRPDNQPGMELHAIRAVSPTLAFASGADRTFLRTTDGEKWEAMPLDSSSGMRGFDTRDGALILAAAGVDILRSTDGGATWIQKDIPANTTDALSSVSIGDARTAYAAGERGTILKTSDAGVTWDRLAGGSIRNINAIQAIGPSHAFAVCDSGVVLKTVDGGESWDTLSSGTRRNLLSLHFLDASVGFISGLSGTLKKTRDGGATWDSLTLPLRAEPIHAVGAWNENSLCIAGNGGRILRSADGGATWNLEISRSLATLRSISIANATTAFAAGDFGTIVKYSGLAASIDPGGWKRIPPALRLVGGRLHADLPAAGTLSGRILTLQGRTLSLLDFGPLEAGPHFLSMPVWRGGPYLLDLHHGRTRLPLYLPRR